MRHRKVGNKFHRKTGPRRSFVRNLANDVIRAGRVETTLARARAMRPLVERLVTLAKRQDLASRRLLVKRLGNKQTAQRMFDEIAPRYKTRPGGYLRISKLSKSRKRDAAEMAVVEFV